MAVFSLVTRLMAASRARLLAMAPVRTTHTRTSSVSSEPIGASPCIWPILLTSAAHNPKRLTSDPPLPMYDITDRGHFADPGCSRLRAFVEARGGRVKDIGICVGTVIEGGVKLEDLGDEEKDDL
jgi:sulfonate dioxygenase